MPAALAAAVRRRAMDWPLMPPSTWAVPSGRNPDRCTVSRSRSWRSASGASVLEVAHVRRGAVLIGFRPADVDHDAAPVRRVLHVAPAQRRRFRPAQATLEQHGDNRLVDGAPVGCGRFRFHAAPGAPWQACRCHDDRCVRIVTPAQLGYPVTKDHGKDISDWLDADSDRGGAAVIRCVAGT